MKIFHTTINNSDIDSVPNERITFFPSTHEAVIQNDHGLVHKEVFTNFRVVYL